MCARYRGASRNFLFRRGGGGRGESKLLFRKDCWTFLWQIASHRDDHVFSQYVNAGHHWRGEILLCVLCKQRRTDHRRVPKTKIFSGVTKCNARFIKKISQLNGDIRSCRCKNFSLKKASDRGRGYGPPGPSPWIHHCVRETRNLGCPKSRLIAERGRYFSVSSILKFVGQFAWWYYKEKQSFIF